MKPHETQDIISHACEQFKPILFRALSLCESDNERLALTMGIACGLMAMTSGVAKAASGIDDPASCSGVAEHTEKIAEILRAINDRDEGVPAARKRDYS